VAAKDGNRIMIECKYHNMHHNKSDVKIPMYIHSRFRDVEKVWPSEHEFEIRFHQVWVVTNTRFTEDAVKYAACSNMKLIGWDYPYKGGIKDMVDTFELYPITCLTTLTNHEKRQLLEMKVVLCKELHRNGELLKQAGVRENRLSSVLLEVGNLCG
jgi:hypothetical protein